MLLRLCLNLYSKIRRRRVPYLTANRVNFTKNIVRQVGLGPIPSLQNNSEQFV